MKLFQIISNFQLDQKPDWFDAYREKYDKPYPYHLTFKQKTFIKEDQIPELKNQLEGVLSNEIPKEVVFNSLTFGSAPKGHVIMIKAEQNRSLLQMQKRIRDATKMFGEVYKPEYKNFEEEFIPHLTIARGLNDDLFEEAKSELRQNITCSALIDSVSIFLFEDPDENGEIIKNFEL